MQGIKSLVRKLLVLIFLFTAATISQASGGWEIVRKADCPIPYVKKVKFIDQNHGWVMGLYDLLYTNDGGETWQKCDFGLPEPSGSCPFYENPAPFFCNVYFINPECGWLADAYCRVLHTDDGGESWHWQCPRGQLECGFGHRILDIFFIDLQTGWAVGDSGSVYRTTDGGENWESAESGVSDHLKTVCFRDSLTGWAIGSEVVLKTADGGKTWQRPEGDAGHGAHEMVFFNQRDGVICGRKSFWVTADGGRTWEERSIPMPPDKWVECSSFISPDNGWIVVHEIVIGNRKGSQILKTTDGGKSWKKFAVPMHDWIADICFADQDHGWAASNSNGIILATNDGGATWQWQVENDAGILRDLHFIDRNNGWAIGAEGLYHTVDGGISWRLNPDMPGSAVYFHNKQVGWVMCGKSIFYTSDGGNSWQKQLAVTSDKCLYEFFFVDQYRGWALARYATGTELYRIKDGGGSWQLIFSSPRYDFDSICFTDSLTGYMVTEPANITWVTPPVTRPLTIYRTTDGGEHWSVQYEGDILPQCDVEITFVDKEYGWAIAALGVIVHTTDGGKTWQRQTVPGGIYLSKISFADRQNGWIAGWPNYTWDLDGAFLHTSDGGETWVVEPEPLFKGQWEDIYFLDKDHGWACGWGGRILKYTNHTSAVETETSSPPIDSRLYGNYPNPFNATTAILYRIGKTDDVELTVFDMLGRKVRSLCHGMQPAGEHRVTWNGKNESGEEVGSGIYLLHLRAGEFTAVRKMCLIR